MKPIIYPKCKLYFFNRDTFEFGTINPELVESRLENGFAFYNLKKPEGKRFLIVQAINQKKASAKMLTLISLEENGRNRKNNTDS